MGVHRSNSWSRGRLSTVELILVLLVLTIVAAVLLPAMMVPTCARRAARKYTCQSNLKECAIALQLYWNDYGATLPSSVLVSHSKTWNRRDFVTFATRLGDLPPDPKADLRAWPEILYRYMVNKDIALCPSDEADHQGPSSPASYYWKAAVDKAWYGVGCVKPCRRASDFAYKADQIVLYERCGFHSGAPQGLRNDVQINVLYLDTHAASTSITNSLPADGTAWSRSCTSAGEPAYFNFDNAKPKGHGNPPASTVRTTYIDPSRYSDAPR